jgi:hypothetical protein
VLNMAVQIQRIFELNNDQQMHKLDTYTTCILNPYIGFDKPLSSSGFIAKVYKNLTSICVWEISHSRS